LEIHVKCTDRILSLLKQPTSHQLGIEHCSFSNTLRTFLKILIHQDSYSLNLHLSNITITTDPPQQFPLHYIVYGVQCIINTTTSYNISITDSYFGSSGGFGTAIHATIHAATNRMPQGLYISRCELTRNGMYLGLQSHRIGSNGAPNIVIEHSTITDIHRHRNEHAGLRIISNDDLNYGQNFIILRNVSFQHNSCVGATFAFNPSKVYLQSVIYLLFAHRVSIQDCSFIGNRGTPIVAHYSGFKVLGTLTLINNTAHQGAALAFYGKSYMHVSNNTHINFINNHAEHVGGAIFVQDEIADNSYAFKCFFQFALNNQIVLNDLKIPNISLAFANNTARDGGDAIYGGKLNQCEVTNCSAYSKSCKGVDIFSKTTGSDIVSIVEYHTGKSSSSVISSDPLRVCLCRSGRPDCSSSSVTRYLYLYPGEFFTISAVVVGQEFGTVVGTVYAQFLPLESSTTQPALGALQEAQQVHHSSCSELKYSVLTSNRLEVMVLSTSNTKVTEQLLDSKAVNAISDRTSVVITSGEIPIFITISLLQCPWGFTLASKLPECVCHSKLTKYNVLCNITEQALYLLRKGTVWVNASYFGEVQHGFIVHSNCPFGYCNPEIVNVNLKNPDMQCAFNHSGVLCGACKPGLSLTLGTPQCLPCSHRYLLLLIFFAAAGILLVLFIKILNITVAEGTINGLIFYVNIVGANQAIFFPPGNMNILTVFISWLSLDFGIQTCFIKGLNGYWKTWLQFVFPVYLWVIIVVIIILSRYFSLAVRLFGNGSVPILATLFLLSYAKLLRSIITSLSFTYLVYLDGSRTVVWSFDANVLYLSVEHVPLFLVALAFLVTLWIPYTTLLLFAQCFQKLTNYRLMHWVRKLKPFFDANFGPFKDKHQYWVGVMLVVRAILLLMFAVNPNNTSSVNVLLTGIAALALLMYGATVASVYKKRYLTLLENSFFMNLGILALGTFYVIQVGGNQGSLVYTLVGIAFLQFLGIVAFHACKSLQRSRTWQSVRKKLSNRQPQTQITNSELHYHRLETGQANRMQVKSQRLMFNEQGELTLESL